MRDPEALLRRVLDVGECLLPGGRRPGDPARYPNVFVHGLLGWGGADALNRVIPYWGLASGDVLRFLNESGYECYAASVGPISSAWDRACELYAQLTGTTVDYGAAHARRFGHDRFGMTFSQPLVPGWSAEKKINLIGHSFGGVTSRLLLELLANGCAGEVEAAEKLGEPVSPLFTGGKGDWVHSVTALAAPHNGSTFTAAQPNATAAMSDVFSTAALALGISAFKGVYDFQLDQFGIVRDPEETLTEAVLRMLMTRPLPRGDNAFDDLSVDGALALNARISMQPQVYYFSEPGCRTVQSLISYDHKPALGMTPLLRPFASAMGRYYGEATPGGIAIDKAWLPNDGLVNTASARSPQGAPCRDVTDATASFEPGVWNVLPARQLDHFAMIGGVFNTNFVQTRQFYRAVMARIDATMCETEL